MKGIQVSRQLVASLGMAFVLGGSPCLSQSRDELAKPTAEQRACIQAMEDWERESGIKFDIPFPKGEVDIDEWLKQPITRFKVAGNEFLATRPLVYLGSGNTDSGLQWHIGTGTTRGFVFNGLFPIVHFDENGELLQIALSTSGSDRWTTGKAKSHMFFRETGESGAEMLNRAIASYKQRAANANDPITAIRLVGAFEYFLKGIGEARKKIGPVQATPVGKTVAD